MPDFASKEDKDIDQWILNYEEQGQTEAPFYRELLEERAKRAQSKQGLNLERSLTALKRAAIDGICITYGDLAKESDAQWSKVRNRMNGKNGHLDRLLEICHARHLPLLTAICVNRSGLKNCELEPNALEGFSQAARRIGRLFDDELEFHHRSKIECWEWGKLQGIDEKSGL